MKFSTLSRFTNELVCLIMKLRCKWRLLSMIIGPHFRSQLNQVKDDEKRLFSLSKFEQKSPNQLLFTSLEILMVPDNLLKNAKN